MLGKNLLDAGSLFSEMQMSFFWAKFDAFDCEDGRLFPEMC